MSAATKIHRVDWRADAFLAGTSMLGPNEGWLYTILINLIYSHGEAIDADLPWIGKVANMHGNAVRAALARLIELGKVRETAGKLMANRCENELETARKRTGNAVDNGVKGGRPTKKNNKIVKPKGLAGSKPTNTNTNTNTNEGTPDGVPIARDAAWPAEVAVPMEWLGEAYGKHPCVDGYEEAAKFVRYWTEGKGKGLKRTDWRATWRGWMARARPGPDTSWIDRYGYDKHLHGQRAKDAAA